MCWAVVEPSVTERQKVKAMFKEAEQAAMFVIFPYEVRPLPVLNGVRIPISRDITPVTQGTFTNSDYTGNVWKVFLLLNYDIR